MDDKIQGGRAALIVMCAVCVAACSIPAWPLPKQYACCVKGAELHIAVSACPRLRCGRPQTSWHVLCCASSREAMPLTVGACRHVHFMVSMAEIRQEMRAYHVWILRRLQRG